MGKDSHTDTIRGLKYISLYETSGYGHAARSYLYGIKANGIPFTWTPMVTGQALGLGYEPFAGDTIGDPELDPFCNKPIDYDRVIVHTVPEYFPYWIKRESNKRIVGYTVWETDRIPRHWPALLNMVDRLLVPCRWNREVFRRCGVTTPIDVVPHISEEKEPMGDELPRERESSPYVFYTIGPWTARKSIWNTIRCYLDTFTVYDRTLLIIKTSNKDFTKRFFIGGFGSTRRAVSTILRDYGNPAEIMLIDDEISDESINALHRKGNCYVSLCRSEGWGLGAFDAAGCGKPVIITGFGGQLDYLPPDFAFLVNYAMTPVTDRVGRKSYTKDQHWAEPDVKHASSFMRQVFEKSDEAKAKGTMLRKHIRETFNRKTVIEKMLRAITAR
jgi:glycosyltransferase involved in cell wall biosynthesis